MTPFKLSPGPPAPLEQSWSPAQLWWCPCSAMDCDGLDPSLQTWLPILALFCHVTTSLCGTGRPACGLLSQLGLRPALSTLTCKMGLSVDPTCSLWVCLACLTPVLWGWAIAGEAASLLDLLPAWLVGSFAEGAARPCCSLTSWTGLSR